MVMKYAKEEGFSIECIEVDTFIGLYQERMILEDEEARNSYEHIRRIESKADFVLLDDVGREHVGDSGWANHIVFNTLRFRSNRKLPSIITSNLNLPGLTERYSQGLVSLLHEVTEIIMIEGEDYRCRKAN
jgi:DNA replication protein DnaC